MQAKSCRELGRVAHAETVPGAQPPLRGAREGRLPLLFSRFVLILSYPAHQQLLFHISYKLFGVNSPNQISEPPERILLAVPAPCSETDFI